MKDKQTLEAQIQEETGKVKEIVDSESSCLRQQLTLQEQKVQDQLQKEGAARQAVTQAIQKQMEEDKLNLTENLEKGTQALKDKLEKDKQGH